MGSHIPHEHCGKEMPEYHLGSQTLVRGTYFSVTWKAMLLAPEKPHLNEKVHFPYGLQTISTTTFGSHF